MKNKILLSLLMVIFTIALTGCGNYNETNIVQSNMEEIKYTEYSTIGLTYELPEKWNVEEHDDGSKEVVFDDASFSVMVTESVPSSQFEYFGETFMLDLLKNINYTVTNSYNKTTYASYDAYDYSAETIIQGQKAPVKITTLNVNDNAVTFLMVYYGDSYDYEAIYEHLLNSLN